MKKLIFLFAGLALFTGGLHAHEPTEGPVALEPESLTAAAGPVTYEFQLVDTKASALITDRELNIDHEKKLHLLAYDPALREFRHAHPEYNGTLWTVTLDLPVNGHYWVWVQGQLAKGQQRFSAGNRLTIAGGKPAWRAPPDLKESRKGADGKSQAALSSTRLTAGRPAMLTLTLSRTDGSKPELAPFLGAFAHVAAVPDDGDSLIHVHPMDGNKPAEGMLHLQFPEKGVYRLWVQFQDAKQIRTVPLAVKVN
jgi:hypothetical protein